MILEEKINTLISLGNFFDKVSSNNHQNTPLADSFKKLSMIAQEHNSWFTVQEINFACKSWAEALQEENIKEWLARYDFKEIPSKTVTIIMAGNIPLVGLHDLICVILSGHKAQIKLSSKDKYLMPAITDHLIKENEKLSNQISYCNERLKNNQVVIATGSNNSARYFEYYFRDIPKIIRKNRSSVAVISGRETYEELSLLGVDIFKFFGLGCRNISKIFIPKNYNFSVFFEAIKDFKSIINHHKYANNYLYHKSIYLMNQDLFLDNGFLILKQESDLWVSPLGVIFYEYYDSKNQLLKKIQSGKEQLQCIVGENNWENSIDFGKAQKPKLWDYADGIDTMDFLLKLS